MCWDAHTGQGVFRAVLCIRLRHWKLPPEKACNPAKIVNGPKIRIIKCMAALLIVGARNMDATFAGAYLIGMALGFQAVGRVLAMMVAGAVLVPAIALANTSSALVATNQFGLAMLGLQIGYMTILILRARYLEEAACLPGSRL